MMKHITEFFLICSGANRRLLEQCTGEKTKYAGLGATIFFTGLFAFFAAAYALYFVFNNVWVSIAFGIIWGLMIFNLDRFIVSTMRKNGNFGRELLSALPRIIVAIVISAVIAKPLELKIFQKEIDPELVLMEQRIFAEQEQKVRDRFLKTDSDLRAQVSEIDKQIDLRTKQRDALLKAAQEEADGTGGSKVKNLGPIYKLKKRDADNAQKELDAFQLESSKSLKLVQSKLRANDSLRNVALSALEFAKRDGPASRMEALDNLKAKSTAIQLASIFVMLLIIAIETTPVFVKLISAKGPYDNLLKVEEFQFSTDECERVASISAEARKKVGTLPDAEAGFLSASLDKQLRS